MIGSQPHVQRSASGTPWRASSMCWPHPAQVGLPQAEQVIREHMRESFLSMRWIGRVGRRWPEERPHRPNKRAKNPPRLAFAASVCTCVCLPLHHCEAGTLIFTIATCCPHPAQVVLLQVRQVVARHITFSSNMNTPRGIIANGFTIPVGVSCLSSQVGSVEKEGSSHGAPSSDR